MNSILLNDGVSIPQLGLGVYKTAEGGECENAIRWALEAGYRHIDTAAYYENERAVGQAVRASALSRQELFVTTKVWVDRIRSRTVRESFLESLDRLDMGYIDLFLIHWPVEGYEDAWRELIKLKDEGLVRSIGVSNFNPHHIEKLVSETGVSPSMNQIESYPYFQNQEVISYCLNHGIAVTAWRPLGKLGGGITEDPVLNALAKAHGKSIAQIIIRWQLQRGIVVIPKSSHRERINENFKVFDFELSAEEMDALKSIDKNQRIGADPENVPYK